MSHGTRWRRIAFSLALIALGSAAAHAHVYVGVELGTLVRARVESPNGSTTDYPEPIQGTDLSRICFKVRNTDDTFDSRITAIGFELPGSPTGFTLESPHDGRFRLVEQVSHVPGLPDVTLDFALITGPTFGGGWPGVGLAPSPTPTVFCVIGEFDTTIPIERVLDRGVLRVQQVGPAGELGDIAVWVSRPLWPL